MHQVLDTWQPGEWRRASDGVIKAVGAACGDASSETRALGRACHAVLTATAPAAAASVMAALPPAVRNQLSAMGQGDSLPRSGTSAMGVTKRGTTPSQRPPMQRTPSMSQPAGFSAASLRSQPQTPAPQRVSSARRQPPRPPTHETPSASRIASSGDQNEAATPGWRPMRQLNTTGRRVTDSEMSLANRRQSAIAAPQRIRADAVSSVGDQPRRPAAAEQEGMMTAPSHVSAFRL